MKNRKAAIADKAGEKKIAKTSPLKIIKRLVNIILKEYKFYLFFVIIAILLSSLANLSGILFLRVLFDDYITPLLNKTETSFAPLLKGILTLAFIYYSGVVFTYIYNRMMMKVSQGTLKKIRDDMFTHMQTLPIKFFDTHAHGDIMSLYTNDTDTLREMISQSLPQLLASVITIISVFISMVVMNIPLTIVEIFMILLMTMVTKKVAGKVGSTLWNNKKIWVF